MSNERKPESVLGDFLREVKRGQENALEITKQVLPDGKERTVLAMQNRVLQPEAPRHPERQESQARCHVFHEAEAFGIYVGKYGGENTVILGSIVHNEIFAVLDDKAEKGREIVRLDLQVHPLWADWKEILGVALTMDDLVGHFMEHRRQIVDCTKDFLLTLSQIRMSSDVTLFTGVGADSVNGIIIKTKVGTGADESHVSLPDMVTVSMPMYVGTTAREIAIDITVRAGRPDEQPKVVLTSSDAQTMKVDVFNEVLGEVADVMGEDLKAVIGLGFPKFDSWSYIE